MFPAWLIVTKISTLLVSVSASSNKHVLVLALTIGIDASVILNVISIYIHNR